MFLFPFIEWLMALFLAMTPVAQTAPDTPGQINQVNQVELPGPGVSAPMNDNSEGRFPCWDLKGDLVNTDQYGPDHPQGTPPGWHLLVLTDDGEIATASYASLSGNLNAPTDHPEC